MLPKTRSVKVILSFLLLAGIGGSVAEHGGYVYEKPAVSFSDGFFGTGQSPSGQQTQTVAKEVIITPKPLSIPSGYQPPQYVPAKPAVTIDYKPQTSFGVQQTSGAYQGSQTNVQASTARPVVTSTVRLQTTAGSLFGNNQFSSTLQPSISVAAKPQSSFSAFQSKPSAATFGASQITGTVKPQASFTAFQSKPSTTTFGASQISGTVKPQASFTAFQSKPSTTTFGASQVSGTVKPQTSFTAFQSKPSTTTFGASQISGTVKPQASFGGSGSSSFGTFQAAGGYKAPQSNVVIQSVKPVSVAAKPQTSFTAFQSKPSTTTFGASQISGTVKPQASFGGSGSSSFGTFQAAGGYKAPQSNVVIQSVKPVSVAAKPQTSFTAFQSKPSTSTFGASQISGTVKPQASFTAFQSKPSTTTIGASQISGTVKPQASFGGSGSSSFGTFQAAGGYKAPQSNVVIQSVKPVSVAAKPQTSFTAFQSKPSTSTFGASQISGTVKPQASITAFQSKPSTTTFGGSQISGTVKPQASFGGLGSSSFGTFQAAGGYKAPQSNVVIQSVKPLSVAAKPQTSFTAFQSKPSTSTFGASQISGTSKPQASYGGSGSSSFGTFQAAGGYKAPQSNVVIQSVKPVSVAAKPQTSFTAFQSKPSTSTFGASQISGTVKPQTSFTAFQSKPSTTTFGASQISGTVKPQASFGGSGSSSFGTFQAAGGYKAPQSNVVIQSVKPLSVTAKPQTSFTTFQSKPSTSTFGASQISGTVKPQTSFTAFQSKPSTTTFGASQISGTVKPQASFGGSGSSSFGTFQAAGGYKAPQSNVVIQSVKPLSVAAKPQTSFTTFQSKPSTSTFGASQISGTVKPQTSFTAFQSKPSTTTFGASQISGTVKPQASFGGSGSSSFGTFQAAGGYKAPQSNVVIQSVKPLSVAAKPQTSFTTFQSKPSTSTFGASQISGTVKPQASFTAFQSKPSTTTFGGSQISGTVKPQASFGGSGSSSFGTFQAAGGYKAPQSNVVIQSVKPVSVAAKPQTSFTAFQSKPSTSTFGASQISGTVKPQTSFTAFQSKPSTTTFGASQISGTVKPQVSFTAFQSKPSTTTFGASQISGTVKPQASFGGSGSSSFGSFQAEGGYKAPQSNVVIQSVKPVSVAAKPQTSFTAFQSKPSTTTFGASQISGTVKPQASFGGSGSSSFGSFQAEGGYKAPQSNVVIQSVKPVSVAAKPQTSFTAFQSKPSTSTFGASQISGTVKPQTSFTAFQSKPSTTTFGPSQISGTVKPQASFGGSGSSSFGTFQAAGGYKAPQSNVVIQSVKPVSVAAKPQTSFTAFQSKPSTTTFGASQISGTVKPQASFGGSGSSSFGTFQAAGGYKAPQSNVVIQSVKPVSVAAKPQTSFTAFQSKPSTTTFGASQISGTVKPQTSFGVSQFTGGYKAPQSTILTSPAKPTISATAKPQVSSFGLNQLSSTLKPAVSITVKPQASLGFTSGQYQPQISTTVRPQTVSGSFSQTKYQQPQIVLSTTVKPSVSSISQTYGNVAAPALPKPQVVAKPAVSQFTQQTGFQTFGQSVPQKPAVLVTAKPQATLVGSQSFTQSVIQKPVLSTVTQTVTPTAFTTVKPQVNQGGYQAFGQSVKQKPAFAQRTDISIQSVVPTAKPQAVVGGFQAFGQAAQQRPVVAAQPIQQVLQPAFVDTVKPEVNFGGYQTVNPALSPKPSVLITPRPQIQVPIATPAPTPAIKSPAFSELITSSAKQDVNLEYLPPIGAKVPSNFARSAGTVQVATLSFDNPSSDFRFPSATANQVVDVAQGQKVEQLIEGRTNNAPLDQPAASAQEHQVEELRLRGELPSTYNQNLGFELASVTSNRLADVPRQQPVESSISEKSRTLQQKAQQTVVKTQLNVLDRDQAASIEGHGPDQHEAESQHYELVHIPFFDEPLAEESQSYEFYELPPSLAFPFSSSSEQVNQVVPQQPTEDLPIQDPQPLNSEEEQIRQLHEKANSETEEKVVQSLQPGSSEGPHVNRNSDQEYNVFDYDQYSAEPESEA